MIGSMCVVLCTHKKVVCMRMWVHGYVCICMKEGGCVYVGLCTCAGGYVCVTVCGCVWVFVIVGMVSVRPH